MESQSKARKKPIEARSSGHLLSSRKISLTCQSIKPLDPVPLGNGQLFLDADKKNGGRLRSPLPSPIPSPIASPIPSPSRSRFQVSRVQESSSSGDYSTATLSPLSTPSPTSTSSVSPSSRFRVTTVYEPKKTMAMMISKPVVTTMPINSSSCNISSSPHVVTAPIPIVEGSSRQLHHLNAVHHHHDHKHQNDQSLEVSSAGSLDSIESFSKDSSSSQDRLDSMVVIKVDESNEEEKNEESVVTSTQRPTSILVTNSSTNNNNLQISSDESTIQSQDRVPISSSNSSAKSPRTRKTSWIANTIPNPATIDKLLSIFQHPGTLFGYSSNSNANEAATKKPDNAAPSSIKSIESMLSWSTGGGSSYLGQKKEDSCPEISSDFIDKSSTDLRPLELSKTVEQALTLEEGLADGKFIEATPPEAGSKIFMLGSSENSPSENNSPAEPVEEFIQTTTTTSSALMLGLSSLSSEDSFWSMDNRSLGQIAHDSITVLMEHKGAGTPQQPNTTSVDGQKAATLVHCTQAEN